MKNAPALPTGKTLFVNAGVAGAVLVTATNRKRTMRFNNAPDALSWCMRNTVNMVYICHPPASRN